MSPKPTLYSTPTLNPATTQILITGASGFIAANIIREALELGYHVRGTARTAEKAANTVKEQNNHPNYTTAVVPDFAEPSAELTAAVKGVDSIIHVASDTSFSEDAEAVVSGVVHSVQNVLRAAVAEPRVKRFTLTSSSTAALLVKPGVEGIVATVDTWNEEAVRAAKKGEGVGSNPLPFVVYAASKTEGEKALWEFVSKEKPNFVANAILPNWNLGRVVGSAGATGMLVPEVFKKGREALSWFVPQYFVDVVDDARLHLIAAVLDEELNDERVFAFAEPFNLNDLIEALNKAKPDAELTHLKVDPSEPRDLSKVPNELGAKLLKKWYGQDGYKSFEQAVKENLEGP